MTFDRHLLTLDGVTFAQAYPILDVLPIGDLAVVLFDPDAVQSTFGQFRNVIAFDADGREVWIAELPTTYTGDAYYGISAENGLTAFSIQSFVVVLDVRTGAILDATFTK
jgi:hypothetical protein